MVTPAPCMAQKNGTKEPLLQTQPQAD